MALEEMSVVVKADIAGYEREMRRAEKIAERFRNQLAGRILGGGTAIAAGAAFVRGISGRMEELAAGEESPLDRWFGPNAIREARSGLEFLEKKSLTLHGIWTGIKDLFAAGVGEAVHQVRFFGIDQATTETFLQAERQAKYDQAAAVEMAERRKKATDSILGVTDALNAEIDKTNMTEGDILRKKLDQIAAGIEGGSTEAAKGLALAKVFEWEQRIAQAKEEQRKSSEALTELTAIERRDRESLSREIERQAGIRQERADRELADAEAERERMLRRSGFGDDENPLGRFQAELEALQRQRAEGIPGLAGLAVRGSQEEARMVNAARNQSDPRHRETINRLDEQIRHLQTLIRTIQLGLGAPFDVQR